MYLWFKKAAVCIHFKHSTHIYYELFAFISQEQETVSIMVLSYIHNGILHAQVFQIILPVEITYLIFKHFNFSSVP
jgi:hypothetical protein